MVKDANLKIIKRKYGTYSRKQAFVKGKDAYFILTTHPFVLFMGRAPLSLRRNPPR